MAITPRTVMWRVAGNPPGPINRVVVTALPQNLGITQPGTYEVDVGDGVWLSRTIQEAVQVTTFARQFSRAVGVTQIDLNAIGPAPVGTTTYADGAGFPSNGVTRSGSILTVDVEAAADGVYVIRRTDDAGARDLHFTFAAVSNSWEIIDGDLFITAGGDDPANTQYSLTPQDGPYAGRTAAWTWGQVPALNPSGNTPGHTIFQPVLAIQSGGQGAEATTGTVLVRTPGLRAYRANATPAPVTVQYRSGASVLSGTGLTYTVGAEPGPFTVREDDGGPSVGLSSAIVRAAAGLSVSRVVAAANSGGVNLSTALPPAVRSVDLSLVPVGAELIVLFQYLTNDSNGGIGLATLGGQDVPPLTMNGKLARTLPGHFVGCEFRRVARPDVGGGVMDLSVRGSNAAGSTNGLVTSIFWVQARGSDIDVIEVRANFGAGTGTQAVNIPTGANGAMLIATVSQANAADGSYTTGVPTQYAAIATGSDAFHSGLALPTAAETRATIFTAGAAAGRTATVAISIGA